ncbi:hypothetical protein B0H15DRAFT_864013, partial [Mycena belliarum]
MGLSLLTATRLKARTSGTCLHWPRSNTPTLFAALTHGPPLTAHTVLVRRPPSARCPPPPSVHALDVEHSAHLFSTSPSRSRCDPQGTASRTPRRTHALAYAPPASTPPRCPCPFSRCPPCRRPRNERPRPQTLTSDADTAAVPPREPLYARLHATACIEPDTAASAATPAHHARRGTEDGRRGVRRRARRSAAGESRFLQLCGLLL